MTGSKTAYDFQKELVLESIDGDSDYVDEPWGDFDDDCRSIYEVHDAKPVDRSQIANLCTVEDIRPGAIIEFCDTLGSRERVTVITGPYTRVLEISGSTITWFDIQSDGRDYTEYRSLVDEGIALYSGEHYHQHHWTELVQPAT